MNVQQAMCLHQTQGQQSSIFADKCVAVTYTLQVWGTRRSARTGIKYSTRQTVLQYLDVCSGADFVLLPTAERLQQSQLVQTVSGHVNLSHGFCARTMGWLTSQYIAWLHCHAAAL